MVILSTTALSDFPQSVGNRDEVATVSIVPAKSERKRRIVQICNWHMIPRELFAKAMKADGKTEAEIDKFYSQHLAEVESVQDEQKSLIPFLVDELQVKAIHVEGLTADEVEAFKKRGAMVKRAKVSNSDDPIDRLFAGIVRRDSLMLGIAGQMSADGKLEVLRAEDRKAFEAANPVEADGTVNLDSVNNKSRESAIVRNMLKAGTVSFIILGSAHDLADNMPDDCEYVRIETKRVCELSEIHHE